MAMPDDVSLLDQRSSLSPPWIRILKRNIGRKRPVPKGLTLQVGVKNSTVVWSQSAYEEYLATGGQLMTAADNAFEREESPGAGGEESLATETDS
jgi:hypothetical protein